MISKFKGNFGIYLQCFIIANVGMAMIFTGCASIHDSRPSYSFRLWAAGDPHVGTDLHPRGNCIPRESLADAIRQSEGTNHDGAPAFDWDIALIVGDFSGNQGFPKDDEGEEVVRQFSALKNHRREQMYCLAGNHDASGPNESLQWWFRKWIDPTGEQSLYSKVDSIKRPYPIEGTWERYCFTVGNILFLVMSDRNDSGPPVGRGERGGYPAGAVSLETFEWWKNKVEHNQDKIIITAHHHMLCETTAGSGPWEGFTKDCEGNWRPGFHGYYPDGGPEGASYLYFVGGVPNARAFEKYLAKHPGAIDLWIGGHTHARCGQVINGRSLIETKWGVTFINASALTKYHGGKTPMSRLLTFIPHSNIVRIQCYLHDDSFAPRGWYAPQERTIRLNKPFSGIDTQ